MHVFTRPLTICSGWCIAGLTLAISVGNLSGQTESSAAQASDTRTARQSDLSGATERGGAYRGESGMGQLNQDHEARMAGGARQQQFQSARGSFAGRGGGGGFRR